MRAAALIGLLLLSGCSVPATSAPASTHTRTAAVSAPPRPAIRPSPAATGTPTAAHPAVPGCGGADLTADARDDLVQFDTMRHWSAKSHVYLTNTSSRACILSGWVGFHMIGYSETCMNPGPGCPPDHTSVRPDQRIVDVDLGPVRTWELDPGHAVGFTLLVATGEDCFYESPWDSEITVAGSDRPVILKTLPIEPCAGELGITALGVVV